MCIRDRVYTDRHMNCVVEALKRIAARKEEIKGLKIVYEAPVLRHFSARFELL